MYVQKLLPERYVLEKQAKLLLEELWKECHTRSGDDVLYREEKVFSTLVHQIRGTKSIVIQMVDDDGNNILHLAGKLGDPIYKVQEETVPPNVDDPNSHVLLVQQLIQEIRHLTETSQSLKEEVKIMPPSFLGVSGAALQMQREVLWFKEVEKLVPPSLQKRRNKAGKTPRELFTEEHKILLKEGERWMKDTVNSCMIVSTLIATMVFAAGFIVPGGNNSDNGIPILLNLSYQMQWHYSPQLFPSLCSCPF